MTTVVFADKAYIPVKQVDMNSVKKYFVKDVFKDSNCEKCEYFQERPCDVCNECPNYEGKTVMYKKVEVNDKTYVGVPLGAQSLLPKLVKEGFKVRDVRTCPKIKYKIKFTGTPSDIQTTAVQKMIDAGYGILNAPARSGKTVMSSMMVCKLRYKTIIIADQIDFLNGFYETFCGSDTQEALTNIPDIEAVENVKIVGFANKLEDFKKYDICLATYQTFLSDNGKKLLKKIRKMFGIVIIDECHRIAAKCFSKVVNSFYAKHRFGLTATVERKDGKEWIVKYIVGPAMAKPKVETLVPFVEIVETGVRPRYEYKNWTRALQFLAKEKKRNELIVKWIINDVKMGRSVVVPVYFKHHVTTLVDMVNKAAGKKIAAEFVGATGKGSKEKRKKTVIAARKYKIKVVIGIRKIIQTGVNVPRWDTLYEVMPISNPPNFYQETSRIRTVYEDKKAPMIRFFLDNMGISKGCFRTCMYKDGMVKMGFKFSEKNKSLAAKYVSNKMSNEHTPKLFD